MRHVRGTTSYLGAAWLAAALALVGCESEQKQTITGPTRGATTASERSTPGSGPGSSRPSRPLASGGSKPPASAAGPMATTQKSTAPPSRGATSGPASSAGSKAAAVPSKDASKPAVGLPPPTYAEIAKEYNARAARLQRVWARAVVSVEFTDDEGKRRSEQGEGHFQVIQPSMMALSAGKLSEVMLWIGCDAERYWFIDAKEKHRAWLGRHAAATRQKIESLGMPAAPRDLLALAGITPLPRPTGDKRRDPQVRWSEDCRTLIFDADRAGTRWRYFINPKTYEPSRIEVIDSESSEPILSATLDRYDNLMIRGDGTLPPRIATRFRCLHHPSGSMLGLSIADMVDGGTNRLREQNFDFDSLRDLLGIREVIDLDARRPSASARDADQE
ncbi:MAG: hypothetical protein JNK58_09370 [Phycisphaerae bacterium]|nr:hypothetical protein [Phycisphaerae bacterium]